MTMTIERLGPGDEATLALLAVEDADFDLEDRSRPRQPLPADLAHRYLANPAVLHWVAIEADVVVGFLYCLVVPLRTGDGQEVLLYEIGVRSAWRRRGVGAALIDCMEAWMRTNGVRDVWVLADNPGAIEFYRSSGFEAAPDQPTYMVCTLNPRG